MVTAANDQSSLKTPTQVRVNWFWLFAIIWGMRQLVWYDLISGPGNELIVDFGDTAVLAFVLATIVAWIVVIYAIDG